LKLGRLYTICAGSGLGKSTVVKELAYDLMFKQHVKIGCIFLEQGEKEAIKDFIAMHSKIEAETFSDNPDLAPAKVKEQAEQVLTDYGVFYKHFGSLDSETLVSKIEYMMSGCDCDFVFLDHISMAVSGQSSAEGERKDIDILMTHLRTVIQSTGKSVIAVSHLKRPFGSRKSYNEGGKVNLDDLRGSASLEQISDFVIALERNQFDNLESDVVRLKVLKSRRGGRIGYADELEYDKETGRLEVL
jgi:twinkle protein